MAIDLFEKQEVLKKKRSKGEKEEKKDEKEEKNVLCIEFIRRNQLNEHVNLE